MKKFGGVTATASRSTFADASTGYIVGTIADTPLGAWSLKSRSREKGQCTSDSGGGVVGFIGKLQRHRTLLWLSSEEIQTGLSLRLSPSKNR